MSSYAECISEVFIKPIRSVLAIDDRFPTLDLLIKADGAIEFDSEHSERLRKLLEYCRSKNPHWLVDVDNGENLGGESLPLESMRQCNWLILDYKLQGDDGDGSKAVSVLRSLASNDHFNLVVIYTDQPPDLVFHHVAVALSDIPKRVSISPQQQQELDALFDAWEESDPHIQSKLRDTVPQSVCFELLKTKDLLAEKAETWSSILGDLNQLIETGGAAVQKSRRLLLRKCISESTKSLFPTGFDGFAVNVAPPNATKKWLTAGNIFVSIERKATEADALLENLKAALEEWGPSPNQLIIAKLRAELEARGIALEEGLIRDNAVQAFWLDLLARSDPQEETHHIGVFVDRQTELLSDYLKPKVAEFVLRLMKDEKNRTEVSRIAAKYFPVDLSDETTQHAARVSHNTHVSTKPRSGKNLSPGHILRFDEEHGEAFWVCLSPACDLEAGRNGGRELKQRLKPWMPFTVLKLHPFPDSKKALSKATRGWVVFLDTGGRKRQFSYFPDYDETKPPVWEEWFASNEGRLGEDFKLDLSKIRLGDGLALSFQRFNAEIVAQLRGEYAVNLTQRLTSHLSRIGLDYEGK